ncbi:hypothetical protein GOG43_17325 [Salmonella enterica subsp. enterica]|nr:hypothetical protein [Salmonella enterica subsp. enterica serovar Wagenia]
MSNTKRVYRDCPDCGKTLTLYFDGNRSQVERAADNMIKNGHVCDECRLKRQQAENNAAAALNASSGLPALKGTEKQIAWAESIRANIMKAFAPLNDILDLEGEAAYQEFRTVVYSLDFRLRDFFNDLRYGLCGYCDEKATGTGVSSAETNRSTIVSNDELVILARRFVRIIAEQDSASWWIDNRNSTMENLVISLRNLLINFNEAEDVAEKMARAEATLQPSEPVNMTVAEILPGVDTLNIVFPDKNAGFNHIVRDKFNMVWEPLSKQWQCRITEPLGTLTDYAAEIAHTLLQSGYIVLCMNNEIREKAINASFEPRYPRWISWGNNNKGEKLFHIHWTDSEMQEAELENLSGAFKAREKFIRNTWYVRPVHWAAVRDFADINGFRITSRAEKALNEAETMEKRRLIIPHLPAAPLSQITEMPLDNLASGVIDESLLDD